MAEAETGSIALTAKIHAMYGKRITPEQYREMVRKQSVAEIASYLKQQTHYGELLRDVNESSVHRGQLENILRRDIYEDYRRVMLYIPAGSRKFYSYFLVRMEIDEILSFLRYLIAGRSTEYLFSLPSFFAEHAEFDLYGLSKVRSYDELVSLLAHTPYADILRKFDPKDTDRADTVQIDSEFQRYFYTYLLGAIRNNFSDATRDKLRRAVAMEYDLHVLTLIVRLKRYFHASPAYIRSLVQASATRLPAEELGKIIDAPDADAALNYIGATRYGAYFVQGSFEYVEAAANHAVFAFNRQLLATSTSSAVATMAYLNLKQLELQNLITIIESVRYGLHPADTEKLLVGAQA